MSNQREAIRLVHEAIDAGITFMDNAREYHDGRCEEVMGRVRYVGFTGHKDPSIHLEMLSHRFTFDTCQLPLNCFDSMFRSFEREYCRCS